MSWLLPALLAIAVLIVLVAKSSKQRSGSRIDLPYRLAGPLFSPAERSFLGVLDQAVGPDHRVFGKVRIADLVTLQSGLDGRARQGALNRIAAKHVDFVVCTAGDLKPICLVELDDSSHASGKAQRRDAFMRQLCNTVRLPLLNVPAQASYSVAKTREAFLVSITQREPNASIQQSAISAEL